jgi:(2R)-3-sulfolactate dehydrogenase (NADP+)
MAEAAATHQVRAEEQGLATHGMSRLPFYRGMLRNGRAHGTAQPTLAAERGGACLIDNRDGLPYSHGIEVTDALLAQIEKLCSTSS